MTQGRAAAMRRRSVLLPAAALAGLLALAGCSGATSGSTASSTSAAPTSASPAPDAAVRWTNSVCGALMPLVSAVSTPPQPNPADPAATKQAYSSYLGSVVTGTDRSLAGVNAAGPAPVPNGAMITDQLRSALTSLRSTFAQAQSQLETADPNNPASFAQAFGALAALPQAAAPLNQLRTNPQLQQAAQRAPNCQALSNPGATPSPAPTS